MITIDTRPAMMGPALLERPGVSGVAGFSSRTGFGPGLERSAKASSNGSGSAGADAGIWRPAERAAGRITVASESGSTESGTITVGWKSEVAPAAVDDHAK